MIEDYEDKKKIRKNVIPPKVQRLFLQEREFGILQNGRRPGRVDPGVALVSVQDLLCRSQVGSRALDVPDRKGGMQSLKSKEKPNGWEAIRLESWVIFPDHSHLDFFETTDLPVLKT